MVCFRYRNVNTLHEGVNKDDNINNNLIYFNGHLLTYRLYVSTKTQINHKTIKIYKNKTLNKQHKHCGYRKQYKGSNEAKTTT